MLTEHAIGHIEWACTDFKRTTKFYGGLFGWEFKAFGKQYMTFKAPGYAAGGFIRVSKPSYVAPGFSPIVYVEVRDIGPYLKRAKTLGGKVGVPKTEIPSVGWYAHLKDPDGNFVGLFQEKKRA